MIKTYTKGENTVTIYRDGAIIFRYAGTGKEYPKGYLYACDIGYPPGKKCFMRKRRIKPHIKKWALSHLPV